MPSTARIRITLNAFRPLGGVVACSATMKVETDAGGAVSLEGKNLLLRRPRANEDADLDLCFVMNTSTHLLLGITLSRADGSGLGQAEFPRVEIVTDVDDRKLTVCDLRQTVAEYDYAILVQEIASGLVGLIDPEIENTNQE